MNDATVVAVALLLGIWAGIVTLMGIWVGIMISRRRNRR